MKRSLAYVANESCRLPGTFNLRLLIQGCCCQITTDMASLSVPSLPLNDREEKESDDNRQNESAHASATASISNPHSERVQARQEQE